MRVIGLTGGIASGKSTVAKILRELGAVILDADQIAKEIVEPGQPAYNEIVAYFGPSILRPDGAIDRPALGQLVFTNPAAREKLNEFTHPRVRSEFNRRLAEIKRHNPNQVVFLDVPLLLESRMTDLVDEIWVTAVSEKIQIERVMTRDGLTETEARQRIASQMPLAEKIKRADRVIDNGGALAETERQVRQLWEGIKPFETNPPQPDMIGSRPT